MDLKPVACGRFFLFPMDWSHNNCQNMTNVN